MPLPALAIGGLSLAAKGLASLFGHKANKKRGLEQNRAQTAALNIQQKQSEDARRARLALANGLLSGVPATTAGGGVSTNVGIDPALMAELSKERTYDFGSAMPDPGAGAGSAFLSGLFSGAADTLPYATMRGGPAGVGPAADGRVQGLTLDDLMRLQRTQHGPVEPAPVDDWMD